VIETDGGSTPTLADAGFVELAHDPVRLEQAARLAACLDVDPAVLDHGVLPALWHWVLFHPEVPTAGLGVDGHPRRRAEMDAFPQRMWVGGRVRVHRPVRLGVDAERVSRVVTADVKEGGAGRFWLVTVGHMIEQEGAPCIEEEQDLVFRAAGSLAPIGPDAVAPPDGEWVEARTADPTLLFRFSAVTANAHRIHYDHPYATDVEGYPDLVVHGPLTAILLAELARTRRGEDARELSYRARAPHFANRRFWLAGSPTDDGAALRAVRADGETAMTLELR
jgi:3-methylfumaryl-CoA hydratase